MSASHPGQTSFLEAADPAPIAPLPEEKATYRADAVPEAEVQRRDQATRALWMAESHAFSPAEARMFSERAIQVRQLYEEPDPRPWIVGYSGGKDSTATLLMVWSAIASLPPTARTRSVTIIATDTGVENPVVGAWVDSTLAHMATAAQRQSLPIGVRHLTPDPADGYLVNLIGKGYAPPRQDFRWCTPRLKVAPGNEAVSDLTGPDGRSLLFLGTRRDESVARRATMDHAASLGRSRALISPNVALGRPGADVCTPIEDWSQTEVWNAILGWNCGSSLPWGASAIQLQMTYESAAASGECGFTVDDHSSCGKSGRFGCYTCTVVEEDRTLAALAQTVRPELLPLLHLRNELADFTRERQGVRLDGEGKPAAWVQLPGSRGYPRHRLEPSGPRRDFRRKRHLPNGSTVWGVDVEDHRTRRNAEGGAEGFHVPGSLVKPWCEYFLYRFVEVGAFTRAIAGRLPASDPSERAWRDHLSRFHTLDDRALSHIRDTWVQQRFWWDDRLPTLVAAAVVAGERQAQAWRPGEGLPG